VHTYPPKADKEVAADQHFGLPDSIDFAGERTPLQISDVKERLDRELLVNANLDATTLLVIKRANRAFPTIEPILKKYGVPDDFKYLAVIESNLVNAVSPAGARGWQFMPETARERGMEVNDMVDERYHLEKATEAA
jgi:membrane-bound lytic murein transglycosylase MltF